MKAVLQAQWLLFLVLCTSGLFLAATPAGAEEKGGMLVDIQKKVLSRGDRNTVNGVGSVEVDRTLSLKADVKNNTMRNMTEAKVRYVVLMQRWASEAGNIERYEGEAKLDPLGVSHSGSVMLGEFHIGGHMHGSSEMHLDRLLAWKVIIERDGKPVEFSSTSNFETLSKRAKPGMVKH